MYLATQTSKREQLIKYFSLWALVFGFSISAYTQNTDRFRVKGLLEKQVNDTSFLVTNPADGTVRYMNTHELLSLLEQANRSHIPPQLRYRTDFSIFIGKSFKNNEKRVLMNGVKLFDHHYRLNDSPPFTSYFQGNMSVFLPALGQSNLVFPINNTANNWYGVFLKDSAGITVPRIMPFIRVYTDNGNTITPAYNRELSVLGQLPLERTNSVSYNFPLLANTYIMTVSGNHRGEIRKIVSNTSTDLTYSGSSMSLSSNVNLPNDWILMLPVDAHPDSIKYLGCYSSGGVGDVFNFYQNGEDYSSYLSYNVIKDKVFSQSIERFYLGGFVPPTATSVRFFLKVEAVNLTTEKMVAVSEYTDGSLHLNSLYQFGLSPTNYFHTITDDWQMATGAGSTIQQSVYINSNLPSGLRFQFRVTGFSE